mgnify:CR=1 FL=1
MTRNPITPLAILSALMAAPAAAQGIDETVNQIFANSTGWFVALIFSNFPGTNYPWIVGWLILAAIIFHQQNANRANGHNRAWHYWGATHGQNINRVTIT